MSEPSAFEIDDDADDRIVLEDYEDHRDLSALEAPAEIDDIEFDLPPTFEDDLLVEDADALLPVLATAPAPPIAPPIVAQDSTALSFDLSGRGDLPLPRIAIHAFCINPHTAEAIRAASIDRRLTKASLTVEMGGVDQAIAQLERQASPNVLIVEAAGPPAKILAEIDRLAACVDAGSKAVVIGAANDIALYRELMRRGVSEYLIAPVTPVQFIRALAALYADPDKPFVGRAAAVMGAKGGVGASTVAQNLAWLLAERFAVGSTLVDLDLPFGTAALNFEEDADAGVAEAIARIDQIDQVYLDRLLVRRSEHLAILPSAASLAGEPDTTPDAVETLVALVRRAAPFTVLDLPHHWSEWLRRALTSVDDVLIVTTPDLAGLRNAKALADALRAARPNDAPPSLVLNMVGVPRRPEIPPKDFAKAIGLEPVAILPFDPAAFGAAANNGEMVSATAPETRAAMALEALARALSGREPAPKRKPSLLARLPTLKR